MECKICLIHKSGDTKDPRNYRPIALMSIGEKLLSIIIHQRIRKDLESKLDERQAGFRKGFSTRHPVWKVERRVENAVKEKAPLAMVFIDFTKAFDSLHHEVMIRMAN